MNTLRCFLVVTFSLLLLAFSQVETISSSPINVGKDAHQEALDFLKKEFDSPVVLENLESQLISNKVEVNQFYDVNNDAYLVKVEDVERGIVLIRTNKSVPFVNWKGIDKNSAYYKLGKETIYPVQYALFISTENTIAKFKVIDFLTEYGYEVNRKSWLKQFVGYKGKEDLMYGKDIDAITGATITASALTDDVQAAAKGLIALYKTVSQGPN